MIIFNNLLIKPAVLAFAILCPLALSAQSGEVSYAKGQDLTDALSDTAVFALPEFSDGRVYFKNMSTSSAVLNISNLEQRVKFIDPATGDTLDVANEDDIKYVIAANKTFYKTKFGYAQVLKYIGDAFFCFVKDLTVEEQQAMTSYGRLPATSTAKKVNALPDMSGPNNSSNVGKYLDLKYDITLRPILIRGNKVLLSSKKAYTKLFPDKKEQIKSLADQEKTDFNDVGSSYEFFNKLLEQ